MISVRLAQDNYATSMKANRVIYSNHIIRSQIEYSTETQTVVVRCILEIPATGQRRGFTSLEALITALQNELLELQSQIMPDESKDTPP